MNEAGYGIRKAKRDQIYAYQNPRTKIQTGRDRIGQDLGIKMAADFTSVIQRDEGRLRMPAV